ncbi:MAG TPA: hypothetical protein VEZ14_01280 [Dehalococcoidia bacterium]|nr:hypothetical protein [Dehalococcoidia bacterium]
MPALTRVLSPTDELLRALWVGSTYFITRCELDPPELAELVRKAINEARGE